MMVLQIYWTNCLLVSLLDQTKLYSSVIAQDLVLKVTNFYPESCELNFSSLAVSKCSYRLNPLDLFI